MHPVAREDGREGRRGRRGREPARSSRCVELYLPDVRVNFFPSCTCAISLLIGLEVVDCRDLI